MESFDIGVNEIEIGYALGIFMGFMDRSYRSVANGVYRDIISVNE